MYTDYLYNLQQHAINVTNWNLKIGPAFSSSGTNSNGPKQKEDAAKLAPRARENPERLGGVSGVLPSHALPSLQSFQKTQHEVYVAHHRY